MIKRFMVLWEPLKKPDEQYLSLVPEEIKAALALKEQEKIVEDWIAADRSRGWILMQGKSETEIVSDLETLPLYGFLKIEITELFIP